MTEKTRVRLGAYFLFGLLLLTLPVTLLVTHLDTVRRAPQWKAGADGMEYVNKSDRAKAVASAQKLYGVSRQSAERLLEKRERETGLRVGNGQRVPYGATVDYYTVDGSVVPNTAKYEGAATVVRPASAAGQDYISYVREQARKDKQPKYVQTLQAMLKKDFLLIPASWGLSQPTAAANDFAKAAVKANTTNIRIAVICTILPGFRDISPRGDGDTDSNDSGASTTTGTGTSIGINYNTRAQFPSYTPVEVCYRQMAWVPQEAIPPLNRDGTYPATGLLYNYADYLDTAAGGGQGGGTDEPYHLVHVTTPIQYDDGYWGSIFDSPGGVFATGASWGIPVGINGSGLTAWDYVQEQQQPNAIHATNNLLQNEMYELFFNQAFSADSCSNWFYQQTHGAVKITGTTNDIAGWLHSNHQLNRYPYQIGMGNNEFIFPGTPVIRTGKWGTDAPVSNAAYDPGTLTLIRASLSAHGLTLLFSQPVSQPTVGINMFTNTDIDGNTSGTQTGNVDVQLNANSSYSWQMDPYDARRWTLRNPSDTGWKYRLTSGTTITYPSTVTSTGGAWTLTQCRAAANNSFAGTVDVLPVGGASEWDNISNPENRGCPSLQNTTVETADLRVALYSHTQLDSDAKGYPTWEQSSATSKAFGQVPFARLKSLWYYTHSYSGGTTRQVAHLMNEWNYSDDIAGTTVSSTALRPKPFDTGPGDAANGGYWPTGAANVDGGREGSSSEYAGDVNNVLRDNGITLTGYQYKVYIEANGGSSQPGDTEGATSSLLTFQPSSSLQNINESGTGVVFHELSHAIAQVSAVDLYDNDLYANGLSVPPPNPTFHECAAMNRYSIMDAGGRLDAWHLAGRLVGWGLSPVQALTQDTLGVNFPEIESMLRDPVIVKMPGNPYYVKQYLQDQVNNGPDTWEEYFLLENRNQNRTSGNGAYGFDSSERGLYIYHIDERSPARNNANQAGFQREDDLLTVIIEQADGMHELEFNNKGNGGATNTDPFGANTASRVTRFWQFPVMNGDTNDSSGTSVVAFAGGSPTSESHGYTYNELTPGGNTTQAIASPPIGAVRNGDVVTITTTLSNAVKAGNAVTISGVPDTSFNGAFNVASVINATTFTYAQTGDDATTGGGAVTYAGARTNVIIPGTETDSFSRIVKISGIGSAMTADCYVEPAELVPTLTNSAASLVTKLTANIQSLARSAPAGAGNVNTVTVTTTAAHGFNCGESVAIAGTGNGTINGVYPIQVDPVTPTQFTFTQNNQTAVNLGAGGTAQSGVVQQGEQNVGFLKLVLENPNGRDAAGLADYTKMSIKDVYMEKLYVLNNGSGTAPADVALAKLFVDSNDNGRFEPATDTLLSTATLETAAPYAKHAIFGKSTDLGYRIPLGDTKTFFVAYDLAAEAQINPHITVGAEFTDTQKLEPRLPGTVQVRKRNNAPYSFGTSNFPIFSNTATIVGYPDRLVLTGDTTNLPAKASQGQLDVPVLRLTAAVNPSNTPRASGSVRMDSIRVDQVGSMDAVSDLVNCKLYLDNGDGAFDASVDGAYTTTALGLSAVPTSSFTPVTPATSPASQRANYPNLNLTVNAGTPRVMFLACSIAAGANPDNNLQLQLSFDPEGAQPQTNCYVQLINNTSEDNSNKDYVWYDTTVTTDWPIKNTVAVDIITPNTAPTPPVAPFSPSGGQQISNTLPTLTWGAGADADAGDTPDTLHYEVQIADNSSFTSPTTEITAEDTTQWPLTTALTLNQQYWWRARTIDRQDSPSAWCTTQTFTVVSNRAPAVIGGGFAPTGDITTTTPTLTWNKTTDPDTAPADPDTTLRYLLQIDDNSDFTSPVVLTNIGAGAGQAASFGPCPDVTVGGDKNAGLGNADDNTYTVVAGDLLTKATTYYWRVAAVDGANAECAWSATQSFKPTDNHAPNTPVGPFVYSDGAEVTSANPVLTWAMPATPDPDPTDTLPTIKYDVELKLGDGDLSTGTIIRQTTAIGIRQWAVGTALTDNGHYYWRVRAVDDQTPTALSSSWSAVQDFWVNTANDAPAAPTTGWDLPNNATTNDTTPTLSWDNSIDPDVDPYDGAYSGAGVVGVSWVVQLTQDPTFASVPYTYSTGPLVAAGRPSVTVTTPLSVNPVWWQWRVRAVDNDGAQSPWSATQRFIVDTTANPPTAPASGFVPVNAGSVGATTSITLRWDAGTDTEDAAASLRYEMEIADNAALATAPGYYYASGLSAAGQTYRTLPAAPPLTVGTTYYWHVRTVDTTGLRSAWSTLLNFTVAANQPPNVVTTGFYPTGTLEITDPTPDLRWNAATPPDPNADDTADTMGYLVEVDDNPGFVNQEFTTKLLPPHATPTTPTVTVTTPLSVGTRYYWRVRPIDRKGTQAAAWSATQDFRVVVNHAPAAPIAAFSPAAWPPLTTANPTLTWNMPNPPDPDVNDTLATIRYEVQLRDQADLASAPYVFTVVTPANTMQAVCTVNLLDNTHYWWRVRSLDAQGLSSDWSAVQNFWINLTNQAPLAPDSGFVPSNGAQVSDDTPTMSWNAAFDEDPDDAANTLHYVVELSTTAAFTTVAYQYTSGDGVTTVTPTVALTDLTTWYWRVRTVDNDGAQSPWSVVQNFNLDVGNQVPTLTDPQVVPLYGALGTYYQLYVTYNDAENDPPVWVRCTFDNGVGPLDMQKVNPGDSNATDGIQYVVGLPGTQLGLGAHGHAFTCQAGVRLPATPTDYLRGPVIGVQSTVRFINSAAVDMTEYEEGSAIWAELVDADQNNNPAAPDTVSVTMTAQGGDSEAVLLTETGNATGVFRGSILSLGRVGAVDDGVLNAIAGAGGNDILVSYRDPDDTTNPAPDTSSDTARIVDTTAPDTIAGGTAIAAVSGQLGLSSGPNGRTVDLDWSSYAEAAQVDVAGYHVWASTSQFATTAGLTALATVPAGTQSYTATQLPSGTILAPSTAYWFAVTAFDEVPLEATAVQSRSVTTHDTTPPIISAHNPAPGTTEVGLATNITFNLNDPGVGIDQSTLVVTLRQNGQVIAHETPLTVTGNDAALQVSVTPSAPLLWNATVNVGVDVKDHDNNHLVVSDWEFDTVTDHVLPTLDEQSPTPDATNVPVSATVSFALHDTGSGINQAATVLIFNGQTIPVASLSFTALADGVRVTYDPPGDLSYNTPYTVSAQGADVAGNTVGPALWSFNTVVDGGSVAVDLFDPARGAVDVPIGTNVSFRLSDSLSGIKESTFRLWIAGQEVTGAGELAIVKVPAGSDHPSTMAVSYNPPADFAYDTDIAVRIYAEDSVGNVTDLAYSFRTIAAPTYNISGIITNGAATPTPIAGVTVTAGGRTAQTDGNGAYRVTGLLAGQYTVTPTRDQYVFTPTPPTVTLGPDDAIANFTGQLLTYALSGTVTEAGTGLAGVTVSCNGLTATTDAQGAYQIAGLANGQYTVTATLANYHFQPPTRAAQVSGANVTGVDFEAVADTFTVEGTITDNAGSRVEGARVECGGKAAVSDAAGHYLITGLRAGSYTVTPTKSGYLMDPLTRSVTVPPSRATQDFTANIEMVSAFPAGVNFIGVPGTPIDRNPMNVFGLNPLQGENCFRWNPAAVPPRYLVAQNDPTAEPIQVKPGRGFFVTFQQARELRVAGIPTGALATTSIGLYEGWNMIANPRALPVKFSSFAPNIPDGIRSFAFVYDNALGSYLMVSADASLGASRDTILGWEGAWVRATGGGVSLLVSGPSAAATPQAMRPQQAELNGGWMIPVVARAGNRGDVSSVAGVVPGSGTAHTIENPPTAPDTVDVYFTNGDGARLAHDVRGSAGAQTFTFVVACAVPDANVTVTLPDLSSVPADLQVLLVDQETGKTQYARTMQAYSYRSAGAASERTFELRVSPRTIGSLAMSATAAQARGGNVTLTYTVTKACNVSVKVMNMAGRCIRELVTDRPVAAGVQSELWNLAAASGTRVPSGTYLLQIEAVTETGQRVRGLAQVRVTR